MFWKTLTWVHIGTRYVPPHLRNRTSDSEPVSEEQMKLTRQLKGLLNRFVQPICRIYGAFLTKLNRLSEQNIGSILESTEEIYRNHRRHGTLRSLRPMPTIDIGIL